MEYFCLIEFGLGDFSEKNAKKYSAIKNVNNEKSAKYIFPALFNQYQNFLDKT